MNSDEGKAKNKERKARSRSAMSDEEREKIRDKNRDQMARKRSLMTPEDKAKVREKNREEKARSRSLKTEYDREKTGAINRVMMSGKRSLMSEEDKDQIRTKDRKQKASSRSSKAEEDMVEMRAKDRERKARSRSSKTEDEIDAERAKDRERKARSRSLKTYEEKETIKVKNKERMKLNRSKMTDDDKELSREKVFDPYKATKKYYVENEREFNRLYKTKIRGNRTEEEVEFDRIELLIKMRKYRQSWNGKDHLLENLIAKRGMQLLREKGRIVDYCERNSYEKNYDVEKWLWFHYYNRSPKNREILAKKCPDVYKTIVENKERSRKLYEEEKQREKELDEAGRWVYCPANDAYYWSNGEMKWDYEYDLGTDGNDAFPCHEMTASDEERCSKQLEEWTEQEMEQQRKERKERQEEERLERNRLAREKRKDLKEKLSVPIDIEENEKKSAYELLREENIKERQEAMKASGWFSD